MAEYFTKRYGPGKWCVGHGLMDFDEVVNCRKIVEARGSGVNATRSVAQQTYEAAGRGRGRRGVAILASTSQTRWHDAGPELQDRATAFARPRVGEKWWAGLGRAARLFNGRWSMMRLAGRTPSRAI